eukprot:4246017-Amphidinium_carterae.1
MLACEPQTCSGLSRVQPLWALEARPQISLSRLGTPMLRATDGPLRRKQTSGGGCMRSSR